MGVRVWGAVLGGEYDADQDEREGLWHGFQVLMVSRAGEMGCDGWLWWGDDGMCGGCGWVDRGRGG